MHLNHGQKDTRASFYTASTPNNTPGCHKLVTMCVLLLDGSEQQTVFALCCGKQIQALLSCLKEVMPIRWFATIVSLVHGRSDLTLSCTSNSPLLHEVSAIVDNKQYQAVQQLLLHFSPRSIKFNTGGCRIS
jgi:hypothetical protein